MLIQVRKLSGMSICASKYFYKEQNSYTTMYVYMYQKAFRSVTVCYKNGKAFSSLDSHDVAESWKPMILWMIMGN
jgi:hypothetical protein